MHPFLFICLLFYGLPARLCILPIFAAIFFVRFCCCCLFVVFADDPLIFSCSADHVQFSTVPDWQPRIISMVEARSVHVKNTHTHTLIPPREDQCEWHRMTRMTGPDCVVMCNLINTHTHTQVSLIPPLEDQCEWHRMARMTGPDCAVMCNLITHTDRQTDTHTHTH